MDWLRGNYHEDYNSEGGEDRDIELVIAMSLTEQEIKKGKAVVETSLYLDEDEMLAWALQECLNVEPPPKQFLVFFGFVQCIKCHACSQSISGAEVFKHKDRLYHKSCYGQMCEVCLKSVVDECLTFYRYLMNIKFRNYSYAKLSANWLGRTQYKSIPIWNQKYYLSHNTNGTPRCCSCSRLEPSDVDYVTLNDGRDLCLECLDSATMDNVECQSLYMDIREFFEGLMMEIKQQIPLLLVERDALNEAMEKEKNHHHDSLTIGVCLSEEQVIKTVVTRPKIGRGNRITGLITKPYKVERHWQVTAILVLYGLPRLFTGSILAHEMMHAWLRLNGYTRLEPDVEEGICQVMAHMWLESETMAGSISSASSLSLSSAKRRAKSEFERKLGAYHKLLIEKNPSRVYGAGFRAAMAAVNRYGLRRALEHIKHAEALP